MDEKRQFRVLYRQFLFRLVDVELLSASAGGDASKLFGQFASILVLVSAVVAWGALLNGSPADHAAEYAWAIEHRMIALTMLVTGVFILLAWDKTFPDRRDVLVLGPLPVRARTLFAAKVVALAVALVVPLFLLNALSGIAWPVVLAERGAGVPGRLRFLGSYWIALLASGTFLYCAVLGVQGIAAQLPRRWYLRVSPWLQIGMFVLVLGTYCLEPPLAELQVKPWAGWLPAFCFTGLLSEWSGSFAAQGHTTMAPLAARALTALSISVVVATGAFAASYWRTLRKVVEEPDVMASTRGSWLPRFGTPQQTALAQFTIRTLMRSRQHRVILAFYLGIGFALATVYMTTAAREGTYRGAALAQMNAPMLAASMFLLCAAIAGARVAFAMPLELKANWVFRIAPVAPGRKALTAVRRALFVCAVVPVLFGAAALFLSHWAWLPVLRFLILFALLGSMLVDAALVRFRKIPFSCSYLPGKAGVQARLWLILSPVWAAVYAAANLGEMTLGNASQYAGVFAGASCFAMAAYLVRRIVNRHCSAFVFEETSPPELILLDLNRNRISD